MERTLQIGGQKPEKPSGMGIYLDYNATAPLCESAKQAIQEGMRWVGNASSVHQFGRCVRQKIEDVRTELADFFSVKAANVIFTSGATEANHLALCGFEGRVVVSAIEHDSVDQARSDKDVCPVDHNGMIDLDALEKWLKAQNGPCLVSMMAANNETGVIQPLNHVVDLAKRYGALVHCDAVQAVGRIALTWEGIDLISLSAHKLGGPQGVGALVMRNDISLQAQLRGGGQERSMRSGTENFLGIMGFGAALKTSQVSSWEKAGFLRDELESRLEAACTHVKFLARKVPRLPNTTVIVMEGVTSATQVMNFDLKGIAISAGAACSSGKVKSSRVLTAMGIPQAMADCSIRVSFGPQESCDNTVDTFINSWLEVYDRTRKASKDPNE